jgi:hypothetical protein
LFEKNPAAKAKVWLLLLLLLVRIQNGQCLLECRVCIREPTAHEASHTVETMVVQQNQTMVMLQNQQNHCARKQESGCAAEAPLHLFIASEMARDNSASACISATLRLRAKATLSS